MSDIRIPDAQWQQFCSTFTRQHHGWLVHMRQVNTDELAGVSTPKVIQSLHGDHPLQEIRSERSEAGAEIMVTVGEAGNETSVLVQDVIAVFSREIGGADKGLRIDSGNGTTTLFEFRIAAVPESLDGLADAEL
jgi:hypothetical protein